MEMPEEIQNPNDLEIDEFENDSEIEESEEL